MKPHLSLYQEYCNCAIRSARSLIRERNSLRPQEPAFSPHGVQVRTPQGNTKRQEWKLRQWQTLRSVHLSDVISSRMSPTY